MSSYDALDAAATLAREICDDHVTTRISLSVGQFMNRPTVEVGFDPCPSEEQAAVFLSDLGADMSAALRKEHGASTWFVAAVRRYGHDIDVRVFFTPEAGEVEQLRARLAAREEEIARLRRQAGGQ
jgi:hypothetical protein